MSGKSTGARDAFGHIAPKFAEITDTVLFDDVWASPGLSPRDRSMITVTTLIALCRQNELPFHMQKALDNGVTRDEIVEMITHLAFYAGWPAANTAILVADQVFGDPET
ncbi:MAG: carboxymuconolactone decarboxylase family protein [Novosphingobium sp.]|nr:carboxymuconolactone decarboxylase family protein [Novosphingobium sp.]MCP5402398.1 carboxymuconolactone decarboxylase family protein [Novosphingobium sp.]